MSLTAAIPFVGRDGELRRLLDRWQNVARGGSTERLLVVAPAGLGKSRLIAELAKRLSPRQHFHLRLQCSPLHRETPFWPVVRYLVRAARFNADDEPAIKVEKLRQMLALGGVDIERSLAALADLLGLSGQGQDELGVAQRRRRVLEALDGHLAALAAIRPVLVTVEDVHWLDPSSIEWLVTRAAAGAPARLPLMLLMTSRPEGVTRHPPVEALDRIELAPLADADICAISRAVARGGTPDGSIAKRSAGSPLLAEELTLAFIQDGAGGLPATLEACLLARLDKLPRGRPLADRAACIGDETEIHVLARVCDLESSQLAAGLGELEKAGILFRRGPRRDAVYGFRHALLRDVVHARLDAHERRAVHGRIFDALEAEMGDQLPELLAEHAALAGRLALAARLARKAGERASATGAIVEAVRHYETAIAWLGDSGIEPGERGARELDLQLELGAELIADKGYAAPATGQAFARAETLCRRYGGDGQRQRALHVIYGFKLISGDVEGAHRISGSLLELAQRDGSARALILGHRTRGLTCCYRGEFAQSRVQLLNLLELYERQGGGLAAELSNDPKVTALCFLGLVDYATGKPEMALGQWRRAVEHARAISHGPSLCSALSFRCIGHALSRRPADIEDDARALLERASEQGLEPSMALGRIWLDWQAAMEEGGAAGLDGLARGIGDLEATGGKLVIPFFTGLLAQAQAVHGQARQALGKVRAAILQAEATGETWYLAELHRLAGGLDTEAGHQAHLARALEIARRQGALMWELRAAADLARLGQARGDTDSSRAALGSAIARMTEGRDLPDLVEARALLACEADGPVPIRRRTRA